MIVSELNTVSRYHKVVANHKNTNDIDSFPLFMLFVYKVYIYFVLFHII